MGESLVQVLNAHISPPEMKSSSQFHLSISTESEADPMDLALASKVIKESDRERGERGFVLVLPVESFHGRGERDEVGVAPDQLLLLLLRHLLLELRQQHVLHHHLFSSSSSLSLHLPLAHS